MSRRIDTHGSRTPWGLHGLNDLESSWRRLTDNRQGAVAATGKRLTVELGGVHAGPNREIGEDLAIIRSHDDQLLRLSAPDEQAALRDIHRHADG